VQWLDGVKAILDRKEDRKINVNATDRDGCLDYTSAERDFNVHSSLLLCLCFLVISFDQGCTALIEAASNGCADIVKVLITAGADLNIQDAQADSFSLTPLRV
jgi:ankyrin repeat protein